MAEGLDIYVDICRTEGPPTHSTPEAQGAYGPCLLKSDRQEEEKMKEGS